MPTTVVAKPLQNRENYAKFHALYLEPGMTVLLRTLDWCYKGQRPLEDHLADLGASSSLRKKNNINVTEFNRLDELKDPNIGINSLDITLLYKLIQLTCDLLPRNDEAWTKACPTPRQGELEHLLFQLKEGRNKLAHLEKIEYFNITDHMVEDKCKEMKYLLTKLLQAAATKGNVGSVKLKKSQDYIEASIQKIESGKNICDSINPHTIQLIVEELRSKECSKDLLKEIEEYSAPKLKENNDLQPLKDILQLNKSSVIVVQGEAGRGKTAMSRFLFNSWLSGNMDSVEGLSSFDVVIRVDCNQIKDRDINLFYERLFPKASFTFPNTNSFKKSLDEFKVFWIMDGFDERTKEFKGFLTAMTKSLSKKHKLLITTRPNTYKDLKGYLGKLSMTSLTLELLQERNVEEIIQSRITEDEKKETFKNHFHNLDETVKQLLRTPLNLDLYIKLWMQDPELVRDTFTTKLLFLKTIYNNLSILKKKLDGRTCWSSKDLEGYVKDWFYGSLCKQSFLMLMRGSENFISQEVLDTISKVARDSFLDPSSCLSTFLIQEKKNDWEDEGEFRYEFHHLTQQYILASLFLKHFKDYDGENVINSISIKFVEFVQRLIEFYVEMIREDKSLDTDLNQVFSPIQSIINHLDLNVKNKSYLWFTSSVASNFNEEYMKKVYQAFMGFPYLDIYGFVVLYDFDSLVLINLTKFLEFVSPQKIILRYESLALRLEDFQPLLGSLIKSQLEIKFESSYAKKEAFQITDNAFCGQIDTFSDYSLQNKGKWTKELKIICIRGNHSFEFFNFDFETLKKFKTLERLEIWINLDSFLWQISKKLPREMVEITTIGLTGLNIENFGIVLEFLNIIKGKETLKFKALHHDFEDISETDKPKLQENAHTVSSDCVCQCKKDVIEKIDKLNITSFLGDAQMLYALKPRHANLKLVFLCIQYKWELCRTLKFLCDYEANLDDVKIKLYSRFRELVRPENRTSSNVLAIPQELVQRTTIYFSTSIDEDNFDEDNFDDYFTLLNNLRGNETMTFKTKRAKPVY